MTAIAGEGGIPPELRFVADTMLGKLATWLRLLGCDVEYFPVIPDGELVDRALRGGRVILTRDTLLVRRRKARANHFFVTGDDYREQLRQVVRHFAIDPRARVLTRCLRCNAPLADVEKRSVWGKVPPYVYTRQEIFRGCPLCGRIYWRGTHCRAAEKQIEEILG